MKCGVSVRSGQFKGVLPSLGLLVIINFEPTPIPNHRGSYMRPI